MTHQEIIEKYLPSPYREQAIENARKYKGEKWLNQLTWTKLEDVLFYIIPTHAEKDEEYWYLIWKRAAAGEFDPPKDPSVTLPRRDWEVVKEAFEHTLDYILIQDGDRIPFERIRQSIQSQLNNQQ